MIWVMFAGVGLLWIIDGKIKKEVAGHAFLASVVAWVTAAMFKSFFPALRPFVTNGHETLVIWDPTGNSFPSIHAAVAFALAVSIWLHKPKIGSVYLLGAFLIGAARVVANVHFSADIVVGAILGVTVALIIEKLHIDT